MTARVEGYERKNVLFYLAPVENIYK
ncbi:hypothetical protein [Arcanobacterium phocisimile]